MRVQLMSFVELLMGGSMDSMFDPYDEEVSRRPTFIHPRLVPALNITHT